MLFLIEKLFGVGVNRIDAFVSEWGVERILIVFLFVWMLYKCFCFGNDVMWYYILLLFVLYVMSFVFIELFFSYVTFCEIVNGLEFFSDVFVDIVNLLLFRV